jgi:tetraacyldisaccharide 4'-kinase
MRAPAFWFDPPPAAGLAAALAPVGRLYAAATARRLAAVVPGRVGVPVVCAGNLSAGGTGKTPTVIAIVERLSRRGVAAHVVSRGYGGRLPGPVRVDPQRHGATDVGDEPLLLSAFGPVWVARDRLAGARAAAAAGAGVVILDDGFQNPALAKDVSIVVADAETGFGNGLCLPAGPLREPVSVGLARADLLMTVGDAPAQARFTALWGGSVTLPRLAARLEPLETGMDWPGTRVFAFAGIGRPEKFFATLRTLGADVVRAEALDDHATLSPALMRRFAAEAAAAGAQLVTTEKDAARLPPAARDGVTVLPVRLVAEDWGPLDALLDRLFA